MTSFNHYVFGAVADWLQRSIAGLAPAEPGYRRIDIRPRIGGGLTHARASHETPYGLAEVGWRLIPTGIEVEAVIPPSTGATVNLPDPGSAPFAVGSGSHPWLVARTPERAKTVASTT